MGLSGRMRWAMLVSLAPVWLLVSSSPVAAGWDPLQKARRAAQAGADALAAGDTLGAIESYLKAQALAPDDPKIRMAVGEAFYANGEYKSSMSQFKAVAGPESPSLSRQSLYNAGNAAFEMGDYQQALDLYTQALGAGSPDADLLYNLELAQTMLEQGQPNSDAQDSTQSSDQQQDSSQDQQQNQQENQQQDQEQQQDQGEKQDQKQQPGQEQSQDEQEQPPQDEPSQQDEPQPQDETSAAADSTQNEPPPPEPATAGSDSTLASLEGMTPEEALRLLDALDHDEEELRKAIQRRLRGATTKSENDW